MSVQLYLGDCLEFMRTLPAGSVDAVVTDPPYGINLINGGGRGMNGWRDFTAAGDWDKYRPSKEYFDEILRVGKRVIIWGGNYFSDYLPPSQQWLVWDKGQRSFSLADCELAWTNQNKAARIFGYPRSRMKSENGLHPTQKPVSLMKWCVLRIIGDCKNVLDPFLGSGTTGIACVQAGIDFTGCEIDPGYFAIAEKRIAQAQMQPRLEGI